MAKHYVDNKKLFEVLVEYKTALLKSPKNPPPIPEFVGECLLLIANHLAMKPNFVGYTFRDDMISDAIENCVRYLHNFDPKKSQNPFAYFSQTIHYAFLRRISREQKQTYQKYKYAVHQSRSGEDYTHAEGDDRSIQPALWMSYENIHEFIGTYEAKLERRRRARSVDTDTVTLDSLDEIGDTTTKDKTK